jgi:hypothetical protein
VWSYSGDPSSSDLDQVRFWIQDTDPDEQILTDEDLKFLINLWYPVYESLIYVGAVACEVIASKFAREVASSADGVNIGADQLQQKYNDLATSLRDQYKAMATMVGVTSGNAPDIGGIIYGETFDASIKPLVWSIGMNDNPQAGPQDRGGVWPAPLPPEQAGAPGESTP